MKFQFKILNAVSISLLLLVVGCTSGQFEVLSSVSSLSNTQSLPDGTTVQPSPSPTGAPVVSSGYLRGINIMDLGTGDDNLPGRYNFNYPKPGALAIKSLKERGMGVIRIPFKWERVQPTLGGPLDAPYMTLLLEVLRDSQAVGMKVIVDMHNYGRFRNVSGTEMVFGKADGPTRDQYADGWKRIVQAIRADSTAYSAIYAFDLMNEPQGLPTGTDGSSPQKVWESFAQAAVNGIRSTGETKIIMVEGYDWSSAARWKINHPVAWITDSASNIMYHAHSYMDNDSSGTFTSSFAQESTNAQSQGFASVGARAVSRVQPFAEWLAENKVPGFIGEFGWPNSDVVGAADAAQWNAAGEQLYTYLDSIKIGATMWATGSWLGPTTNILNAYVLPGSGNQVFTPLSQAATLEAHPGK